MLAAAFKKFSFTKKLTATRPDHIFLVRGKDAAGHQAWYYVMIDNDKRDIFPSREGAPYLKLTDYGQILYSGFGEDSPAGVKKKMEEEYGFTE